MWVVPLLGKWACVVLEKKLSKPGKRKSVGSITPWFLSQFSPKFPKLPRQSPAGDQVFKSAA